MSQHLQHIELEHYVHELNDAGLRELSDEIRDFLIEVVLENGGHFSGNLGVVELTVALHHLLDLSKDTLIWDVGHQSYPHKILTGRKDEIKRIRKKGGISGFPNIFESDKDSFGTGHSSTSISACLGMAVASQLQSSHTQHVAVIGDGSLTGGMAWEALSNAGSLKLPITVVINDNNMGIDPNQGAIGEYLNQLLDKPKSHNIFTEWGFEYFQVKDGHDMGELLIGLKQALKSDKPRIVHVRTIKGKGYPEAEKEQTKWHAVKYVKLAAANKTANGGTKGDKFQDIFGRKLLELAKKDDRVVGITPAMPSGSSFHFMMKEMPERVFDVGIAEQHAVTFTAGLARKGLKPFCNIYSSFFQRAIDQFIHDVALQKLNAVFCLDRAGIVGEDGATHHGLYDLALLSAIPNVVIAAPLDGNELEHMMETALDYNAGPFVIRYPRGRSSLLAQDEKTELRIGKARQIRSGQKAAILSLGSIGDQALLAYDILLEKGWDVSVFDMRYLCPIDEETLASTLEDYPLVFTLENATHNGGLGSLVAQKHAELRSNTPMVQLAFPKMDIGHAKPNELLKEYSLDAESIASRIESELAKLSTRP